MKTTDAPKTSTILRSTDALRGYLADLNVVSDFHLREIAGDLGVEVDALRGAIRTFPRCDLNVMGNLQWEKHPAHDEAVELIAFEAERATSGATFAAIKRDLRLCHAVEFGGWDWTSAA